VVFHLNESKAKPEPVTIPGHPETPSVHQSDNLKYHTDDWFKCMRSREKPNGCIETGYREGKKLYCDRKNQQILDHALSG
jgi:hypothetical protein